MDATSEAAFPLMDREAPGRRVLAYVFLNSYLEASGDYAGVAVLPFYLVYRAVVRAKIGLIRAAQHGTAGQRDPRALHAYPHYLAPAPPYAGSPRRAVLLPN